MPSRELPRSRLRWEWSRWILARLRMAREIEALQMAYMIPLVQHRQTSWEFYFRRSHYWACLPQAEVSMTVFDAANLAEMPGTKDPVEPCR